MSIEKPEVDFPGGEPPADLQVTDVWEGDGAVAKAGDTVEVHYVGVAYSTGEEFDASWNRGAPLQFQLGVGKVIAGWDQGVQGMKVGGRRQLIIPPGLAYGDRGHSHDKALSIRHAYADATIASLFARAADRANSLSGCKKKTPIRPPASATAPQITKPLL